jgi:hypothetical protein
MALTNECSIIMHLLKFALSSFREYLLGQNIGLALYRRLLLLLLLVMLGSSNSVVCFFSSVCPFLHLGPVLLDLGFVWGLHLFLFCPPQTD